MTHAEALRIAGALLAYPDKAWLESLPLIRDEAIELADTPEDNFTPAITAFIDSALATPAPLLAERYVAIYDHTPAASLYLTWHRYGNDRSQGKAMAALNGLYRAAGLEPVPGCLPDYLPRVLEFLSLAPEWACEAILDGFGPEIMGILDAMTEYKAPHAEMLRQTLQPFRVRYPGCFRPRTGPDATARPMARPDPEPLEPLIPVPEK